MSIYSYDANGNVTSDGSISYVWEHGRKVDDNRDSEY